MEHTIRQQIQDRFRLETSLLRLRRQREANEAALRQAKFDLREAKARAAEYRGSFQSLRDRMKGEKEQRETQLRHEVAEAEAALTKTRQEKEMLDRKIPETEAKLADLPAVRELRERAQGEDLKEFCRLEVLHCIEAVEPLLAVNLEAIEAYRRRRDIALRTLDEYAALETDPGKAGEACRIWIQRITAALEDMGIPFGPWSYYENPAAFILSAAADHNRWERTIQARDQIYGLQRELCRLRIQLEKVM